MRVAQRMVKCSMKKLIVTTMTLLACASYAGAAEAKPNILFLFADDQRADTIAALGNPSHQDAQP